MKQCFSDIGYRLHKRVIFERREKVEMSPAITWFSLPAESFHVAKQERGIQTVPGGLPGLRKWLSVQGG